MKNTKQQLAVGLVALWLGAAPLTGVAAPPHTGIQGSTFATLGPVFNGPPPPIAPPSVTLPVRTSFTLYSARTGREVAQVTADANGVFSVPLHPGSYVLVPEPLPRDLFCLSFQQAIEVTVSPRQFTSVQILYFGHPCHIVGTP
jgi:hypothetical protein